MPAPIQPSQSRIPAQADLGAFEHLAIGYPLGGWSFRDLARDGDGLVSGRFVNNLTESGVWVRIDEAPEFGCSAFEFAFSYNPRRREITSARLTITSHKTPATRSFEGAETIELITHIISRGLTYLGAKWLKRALLRGAPGLDSSAGESLRAIAEDARRQLEGA